LPPALYSPQILATEVEARVAQIEDMEVAQEEALRAGLAELQAKVCGVRWHGCL
jgi:hypothetical protein